MRDRSYVIDIDWKDRKLAKHVATDRGGRKKFGEPRWSVLKRRLVALEEAEALIDLRQVGGFHAMKADLIGAFAMKLDGAYRLVIRPNHNPPPLDESGGIDLALVTAVIIEGVVNYHD